jgi:hypothetical protein
MLVTCRCMVLAVNGFIFLNAEMFSIVLAIVKARYDANPYFPTEIAI